ncbi:phospholipase [Paraburkholderia sp. GAS82]|uniref:phospholipase n=1 Tax=Paraburkholderia sp. GAS82 TaxID=3035137 RepID=UPI003D199FD9
MEVDSEPNICHERMDVTQSLRRHLWDIHIHIHIHINSIEDGASDDPKLAAAAWEYIISRNAGKQKNGETPFASLVGFMWTGASCLRLD